MVTAPVAGSRVRPAGQLPAAATVALPPAPRVAGAPFTVLPARMFVIGVEAMPAVAEPFTGAGIALPLTRMESLVLAQLAGVLRSHRRYTSA